MYENELDTLNNIIKSRPKNKQKAMTQIHKNVNSLFSKLSFLKPLARGVAITGALTTALDVAVDFAGCFEKCKK